MRRARYLLAPLVVGALIRFALGCEGFGADERPSDPTEAGSGDGPTAAEGAAPSDDAASGDGGPCDPALPFGPAQVVSELTTAADALGARLTADQLTIFYGASQTPGPRDLFRASRGSTALPFTNVAPLGELDTDAGDEGKPSLSSSSLYFHRSRAWQDGGSAALYDLWVARRLSTGGFDVPVVVGPPVGTTDGHEFDGFVSTDGEELFFTSTRNGATKPEIWHATNPQADGGFATVARIDTASMGEFNNSAVISADRRVLYFGSGPATPTVDTAIWMARRPTTADAFGPPTRVVELDEKDQRDEPSWISPDQCTLYFFSNRTTRFQIYRASRRP